MSDIQEARDILAKWRTEATQGSWHLGDSDPAPGWEHRRAVDVDEDGSITDYIEPSDARLIAGTAGNSALLDAIDYTFVLALAWPDTTRRPSAFDKIAAAIIKADREMSR